MKSTRVSGTRGETFRRLLARSRAARFVRPNRRACSQARTRTSLSIGTCGLRFRRAFSQCFLSNARFFQRNRHTATILLKNRIVCEYYQRSRATTTRKDSFNKQNRSSGRTAHFWQTFFLHRATTNIKFDLDGNAIVPLFFFRPSFDISSDCCDFDIVENTHSEPLPFQSRHKWT